MPVVHLRVEGKVQGVGFRWFVRDRAQELGLAGWVRNISTGEVEVLASGEHIALAALESAVARGPSGALVTAVHHVPVPPNVSCPNPFTIKR